MAKTFKLVLIKPSHYDDDGYVIQWWRSGIPSNTLASLYGLARDCAERRVLGADVDIEIAGYDETNTRIRTDRIAREIETSPAGGLVMIVGVQSNQMPRALDIAAPLRARGIAVGIGGFHVSGTIAMLPDIDPDVARATAMGVFLFAGEAEDRLEGVLLDAFNERLKPLYNYLNDLPGIDGTPVPHLPPQRLLRTAGALTSFDAGRGCPYQCSFCTIINVQGRKSRRRSSDDIEAIVRENAANGVFRYFITDDNFARNKDWEAIFDRMIALRREGIKIKAIIQVDTLCHNIPNFIEKAAKAGVSRVFIGLENINPDSLIGAKKRQNKITEYRKMLLAWKAQRVTTYAGYILGFPNDTPASIRRDIEIIKRELPIDILEFFFLTPLPGSEDHKVLHTKGVPVDADMNRYDLNHVCTDHPVMSRAEWEGIYRDAWRIFYSDDHVVTVQKRAAAMGLSPFKLVNFQIWFKGSIDIEGVHPLESGYFRLKSRRDRRPTLPIESPFLFYPRYAGETLVKLARWGGLWLKHGGQALRVRRDRERLRAEYADIALTPVDENETETLELFKGRDADSFVARQKKIAAIKDGVAAA
ncbi:B12-binding domain-containing radical SAM protein [Mangrovibrevibacter kandeliae]|uniref:B12-binding domain-containing radical SAM protein n=1 Tax=Mangrovibrevibacter kandeliae TaxID=2968473 RepID=UPI002118D304|nr:radical SAM protein [Aurantimonas sp. CSK15Z-1]MCQ8784218.1 radical SAM protein [Aurantimonas sp. CSK15Z-1]